MYIYAFTLEIVYYVIANNNKKINIMIGREVLSLCFDVNITQSSFSTRKIIYVCDKITETEINVN